MLKSSMAAFLAVFLPVLFFAPACDGPAGACEDTAAHTCQDGKKANCTWTEGKLSKEEAEKLTKSHAFSEGKKCTDLGYNCASGPCTKK